MRIDEGMPSATIPDWSREYKTAWTWFPSRSLLASLRSYQKWQRYGLWGAVPRKFAVLRHRFWSAVTGCDLPINTVISGGLLLPHPNGVVIHPLCKIGPNCLILQQVTLGTNGSKNKSGVPSLGGHVDVGAGAKILGPVIIGDNAVIGANSVVLTDVPANALAIGVPARIILRDV